MTYIHINSTIFAKHSNHLTESTFYAKSRLWAPAIYTSNGRHSNCRTEKFWIKLNFSYLFKIWPFKILSELFVQGFAVRNFHMHPVERKHCYYCLIPIIMVWCLKTHDLIATTVHTYSPQYRIILLIVPLFYFSYG